MPACNGCNRNATSVIIRRVTRVGLTYWPNTGTAYCTFRAVAIRPTSSPGGTSPMARARRRTRATTSRIRCLSSSLYLGLLPLPPSWQLVPPPSRLAFCTQTSRPLFARRSCLTWFVGPWRRRNRRRTPPRPARCGHLRLPRRAALPRSSGYWQLDRRGGPPAPFQVIGPKALARQLSQAD